MSARSWYLHRRRHQKGSKRTTPIVARLSLGAVALMAGLMLTSIGVAAAAAVTIYNYYAKDLPAPGEIVKQTQLQFKTTRIYDRTGTVLLYEIIDPQGGNRTVVPLDRIPDNLKNATIALEDKDFWKNPGFDWYGIARAAYLTIKGEQVQGASTITQQLVKNVLIPPSERMVRDPTDPATYSRKAKELILSNEISRRYKKEQILEWYLNANNYGSLAYGVEAAAETYFGKHVQDLDLAECATLAAIPQYPALNPIDDPQSALQRRNIVLDVMLAQKYITPEEAAAAKSSKLKVTPKQFDIRAPHFVFYVRRQLEDRFGTDALYSGLNVYTTLDYNIQQTAEQIARDQVAKLQASKSNVTNASVVVMRPNTGEILAMVGSVDYFNRDIDGQVNIATSQRQPGSSFKIFNYLTAFAQGYTAASMLMDVRTVFDDSPNPPYVPENYDRKYHGPVRLRTALASSFNIPAVDLINQVGVKNVVNTAHRMGINSLNSEKYGLALTLGGGETSLLDMTYANSVLANQGTMVGIPANAESIKPGYRTLNPISIVRVVDSNNKTLYDAKDQIKQQPVLTPQLAYLMSDILSDNVARTPGFGSNSVLKLSRPAAVKTGTTSDWRDNWTIGYSPDFTVGVWVGNADNSEMEHISGVTGAGPIWHDVMEKIHQTIPVHPFTEPPGMVRVEVCATSGLLPTPYCPERVKELFIAGTEPKAFDNIWQPFRIHRPSGKLATVYCPPDQVEDKVFPIYPPKAADWVRENNIPQPPTEYTTACPSTAQGGDVAIVSPTSYSTVRGVVTIVGNTKMDNLDTFRLAFGKGIDPTQWTQIGSDRRDRVDNSTLATWDTSGLDGLYTLKLTAVDRSGRPREAAIQLIVDNQPPTINIIHPENGDVYSPEKDEWVSIGVEAIDNASMSRVEFYVDGAYVGASTVAPFNRKWTIKMSDNLTKTLAAAAIPNPPNPITVSRTITNADGTVTTEQLIGQVNKVTSPNPSVTVVFTTGMTLVSNTVTIPNVPGLVETHLITAAAIDAAGNRTESPPISIFIQHALKDKK